MNLHSDVRGDGGPVVLLHGFTTHGRAWEPICDRLAPRFRVVTIDLPGHGRSPAPPAEYTFQDCVDDVIATMARHAIDADHRGALIGYSMGGRIALAAALRAPQAIDRLILESASPGIAHAGERANRRAADARLAAEIEDDWPATVDRWLAQPLFAALPNLGPGVLAQQRALRRANSAQAIAAALRCLGVGEQPSYWDRLAEIRQPVLLVTGALDAKFDDIAARMHQQLPDARRQVIAGAGHATHLENPDAFAAAVGAFLDAPASATTAGGAPG